MTDVIQALVSDAKKNRFSTIPKLTDEDVVSVWDNVSQFIERHMSMQKGVQIPGLGIFTFSQKKLDIGNNKYILIQRPVFLLSEKFAMTHALNYSKYHTTGQIPIVQLNFSALSTETPFDRDTVEGCVKEVLLALSRAVGARRNVEFTFSGIGRLAVRDGKVKMKFYKDFLQMMDGSGSLAEALKNRPDTADSVMSRATTYRPHTSNTLVLPRIGTTIEGLAPEDDGKTPRKSTMPAIKESDEEGEEVPDGKKSSATQTGEEAEREDGGEGETGDEEDQREGEAEESPKKPVSPTGRGLSRQLAPTAKATGISLTDDLLTPQSPSAPRGIRGAALTPSPPPSKPGSPREMMRPRTTPEVYFRIPTPPSSACGHSTMAGQELCYLCHQRESRNIPISFELERRRKEMEQDRLLQQFQHMKDTEAIVREQAQNLGNRHESQKIAAFNLGVAEAIKNKKRERSSEFHRSYVFQHRPLTPPRFLKQDELATELAKQVENKVAQSTKRKHDQEFLERLEQVQLAEDLAFQREQYLKEKREQCDAYQRALSAQIRIRNLLPDPSDSTLPDPVRSNGQTSPTSLTSQKTLGPLSLPVPKIILPFNKGCPMRLSEGPFRVVRFKPLPLPGAVSDSKEPIFGKNDFTNEKLAEQRRRAHELYQEQLETVAHRKRDKILRHLKHQKDEVEMLERTRRDLIADRAGQHERNFSNRKSLESDWKKAYEMKRRRELEERLRASSPGMLLHEQCDKYHRCAQCKRRVENCGESNIWSESRYIPGSRLIM